LLDHNKVDHKILLNNPNWRVNKIYDHHQSEIDLTNTYSGIDLNIEVPLGSASTLVAKLMFDSDISLKNDANGKSIN